MDWHRRYLQQAAWTRGLREYLFARAGLPEARRVLEVGSGTGAVLADVTVPRVGLPPDRVVRQPVFFGLDIDRASLSQCQSNAPTARLIQANALTLPFPARTFDIVFCHFFLLWVGDPLSALRELRRTAISGGHILALAEPDFTQRVDAPEDLAEAGSLQTESLRRQGADVAMGSRMAQLFEQAGLRLIEAGLIQPTLQVRSDRAEGEMEWHVLEADLGAVASTALIDRFRQLDSVARRSGLRRTYVPTFFAWGQV